MRVSSLISQIETIQLDELYNMILKTVFARFYKSFNFDYLRKAHPEAKPLPWEYMEHDGHSLWYPHVRIPIDAKITTVVGANESGKSQLLSSVLIFAVWALSYADNAWRHRDGTWETKAAATGYVLGGR